MGKKYYVITGGTMVHVAPHFSLCAPAYGGVGYDLEADLERLLCQDAKRRGIQPDHAVHLLRTKMASDHRMGKLPGEKAVFKEAGIPFMETNEDLSKVLDVLIADPDTAAIVMAVAICDWQFRYLVQKTDSDDTGEDGLEAWTRKDFGKRVPRLKTADGDITASLMPTDKLIGKIRSERKDIFLVGFKATTGMSEDEQYITGLGLLKDASCNLVLANDVHTRTNMVITPEEARHHVTSDREEAIRGLAEMIVMREGLTFTRSTVIPGDPIPWESDAVPASLRTVVDHCIARGAYKPFKGKTVGHFATRGPEPGILYTSRRKSDFNRLPEDGLLRIDTVDDDKVIAHGAKPSVGGQSQRIIFERNPHVDCIVHFHCPRKPVDGPKWSPPGVREQRPYECGSHECGQNTSDGLRVVAGSYSHGIQAVYLEDHGPNICFPADIDPDLVIEYIEEHFDLTSKTGGPVFLGSMGS